jgi:sulfate adenylyltransferase
MSKILDERELCDLECIVTGVFSPLTSYMTKAQYQECLLDMSIDSQVLPIPIVLSATEDVAVGTVLELKNATGVIHAKLTVQECWVPDLAAECKAVFGCFDDNHPYIKYLLTKPNLHYVSGSLTVLNTTFHNNFLEYRKTPAEMAAAGPWTGFQTRNPLHRSHIELIKNCSGRSKILLHPVEGVTQECDIPFPVRMACYQKVLPYLGDATLSILPLSMRMAGPREAVWHAVIRRNYGCSHFIVGRDHAGPSYKKKDGTSFFHPLAAQDLAKSLEHRLGLTILTSEELVYCENTGQYKQAGLVTGDDSVKNISGTLFRSMLESGADIPSWYSYPEVVDVLRAYYNKQVGICYYFVGLSGSGKSTYAEALKAYFDENMMEATVLDADVIRTHLSKGLGFSKEDRSMNVRRIGYVASEIVRHGGIVIVANIAPFAEDRAFNRRLISQHGRYVEIFVDTALDTCAERDVKGLYKAAFAGTLKNFTGVSDPFEAPTDSIVVTPIAKEKLALPLRAYLPSLRLKNKILVLGASPALLRFLASKGFVVNHPEGHDSLLYAYPNSTLVCEYNPSKILYVGGAGPALGLTNNLSAGLLGVPAGSLESHAEAWRTVKNVVFVKSAMDIETSLGLETGSCAEYIA